MANNEFDREIPVPQLARFRLLGLKADHNPITGKAELKAEVKERFEVELTGYEKPQQTAPKSSSDYNCQIDVRVTFIGKWSNPDDQQPVVEFEASYQGRFVFNSEVDIKQVDSLLATKFYRDSLVAQVYPLAYNHMVGELRLMGVNSSRKIGFNPNYDVKNTRVEELSLPRPKRLRRQKKSAT